MTTSPARCQLKELQAVVGGGRSSRRPVWEPAISLSMRPGEVIAVLGDSGSGKSTLLHCIAGLHPQGAHRGLARGISYSGQVLVEGADVTAAHPRDRRVGLVMQRASLYPTLSVRENLEFPLKLARVDVNSRKRLAEEAASQYEIDEILDKSVDQISGGQAQRVSIAKMMMRRPSIALFDEAFASLDPTLRIRLRTEVIEPSREKGLSILWVTHNIEDAAWADRILSFSLRHDANGSLSDVDLYEGDGSRGSAWRAYLDAKGLLTGSVDLPVSSAPRK